MKDSLENLAAAVQERIRFRKRCLPVAQQIVQNTPGPMPHGSPLLGVDDVPIIDCTAKDVKKECAPPDEPFSCPSSHSCPVTLAYACEKFSCTLATFSCENTVDHICLDMFECGDFMKGNDHTCSGTHVFRCEDDFYCYGTFTCKAPGEPGGKCTIGAGYSIDGGKDKTSGDFICGYPGGNPDDFDCNSVFKCEAGDDFRCRDSTDFDCGTGDPGDSFSCGAAGGKTQFQCDSSGTGNAFTCTPSANFSCVVEIQCKKPSPFNCTAYVCPPTVCYRNQDF